MNETSLNRRDFLKVLGTAGVSLVIGIYLGGCTEAETATSESPSAGMPTPEPEIPAEAFFTPNIYLTIDNTNQLTVTAFRSEMGQGIRTAIAMIVADELDVPWEQVKIKQALADSAYGDQVTGGSASIQNHYAILRRAGAQAREMLKTAAAQQWGVAATDCTTNSGFVVHPDGEQRLSYGELATAASVVEPPRERDLPLKPPEAYTLMGTNIHHWDAPAIITGKTIYGFDVKLPGMLYATIARCPVFGGTIASFDGSKALEVPGVKMVQAIEDRIAVVAENTWAAIKGRKALEIEWDFGSNADLNSAAIRDELAARAPQPGSAAEGEIEAIYDMPFEAHMTMEPMNCTASVHDGVCEVWAPTQSPQEVQRSVARYTGIPSKDVTVNVTLLGGGFGRRLQADYGVEAALVSQAVGAPVQVIWTRDDDVQHDYYHPTSYHYASADPANPKKRTLRSFDGTQIPTGAWRSVGEFTAAYPRECFIDELAFAAGRNPLEMRQELYSGRGLAVIELAAEEAGWGEPLPAGWGRGIAYHATFGVTHVAMVMEVEVNTGKVRVHRVVVAVDCGQVINPDNVAAQMEGGVAFGLTAALKAQVTLDNGRVQQSNFADCPILAMPEMPAVETYFVESTHSPSGIGEMGVPPVAPALANAVFAATGKRVRHIPIQKEDLAA